MNHSVLERAICYIIFVSRMLVTYLEARKRNKAKFFLLPQVIKSNHNGFH